MALLLALYSTTELNNQMQSQRGGNCAIANEVSGQLKLVDV